MKDEDSYLENIDLNDIHENIILQRKAIGFVSDHVQEEQTMAVLMGIERQMEEIEKALGKYIGRNYSRGKKL